MHHIENFLSCLDGLQSKPNNQYFSICPAHADKSPSLSVKIEDDETILIYCFAGCSPHEIVSAVGLELHDLFPPNPTYRKSRKPRWNYRELLQVLSADITLVYFAAVELSLGKRLNDHDFDKLCDAVRRIKSVEAATNG